MRLLFTGIVALASVYYFSKKNKNKKAISLLSNGGVVKFIQTKHNLCRIECDIRNITSGLHGLHVHECGNITEGCGSTCAHYNPDGKTHGGPFGTERHRGDLGNIEADEQGVCEQTIYANINVDEIIGRGLVLHKDEDDLGQGLNEESLKTGNAGERIACGVIGILN